MNREWFNRIIIRSGCCSLICVALFYQASISGSPVAGQSNSTVGPERGWLVLEGGGKLRNTEVLKRFMSLAGGSKAALVEIPSASLHNMGRKYDSAYLTEQIEWCKGVFGTDNVSLLHTSDSKEADSEKFVEPLRHANSVWFEGGDHAALFTYVGTRTELEIKALLARGGVVGGTSAGAMIMGSVKPAFGLLNGCWIFPHFFNRRREVSQVIFQSQHPELLVLGIDESTAMVVHGDVFEVVGEGHVTVIDGRLHGDTNYLVLSAGQRYNLKSRAVIE